MDFKLPAVTRNSQGQLRKVGFELEFGRLDLDEVARCIQELYGGQLERESTFLMTVKDTALGTFSLKMDSRILTEKSYENWLTNFGIDPDGEGVEGIVESIASLIIPYEVGTPAVPITEIDKLDKLRQALFQNKASGTRASIFNAYATHINAEIPSTDVSTILNYIRAFLLMYPLIFERAGISLRRRWARYIEPFPKEYARLVLDHDYQPDMEHLLAHYHLHNPDRNRPLDMYPLLAWLNKEAVAKMENIGNVKPRPTLHYRLPNSLVDEPEWSLAHEWNNWVLVEDLASQPKEIEKLSSEYLALEEDTYLGFNDKWVKHLENWLHVG